MASAQCTVMAANKQEKEVDSQQTSELSGMESINRITKLPVVESTMNIAHNVYDKIKESHTIVNSVLSTAEATVKQATEAAQPLTAKFEGPIKKVDSLICTGLDYVEEKVPAIKLPPGEMYESTKEAINSKVDPAISGICAMAEYSKQKVSNLTAQRANGDFKDKSKGE